MSLKAGSDVKTGVIQPLKPIKPCNYGLILERSRGYYSSRQFSSSKQIFRTRANPDKFLAPCPDFFSVFSDPSNDRKVCSVVIAQISAFPSFIYKLEIMKRDHRRTMWKHSNKLSPRLCFPLRFIFVSLHLWVYVETRKQNPVDYKGFTLQTEFFCL